MLADLVKKLGEDVVAAVKAALLPALKPLLKGFANDVIALMKSEAAKTATPIDDFVVASAEPMIDGLVDQALAKL